MKSNCLFLNTFALFKFIVLVLYMILNKLQNNTQAKRMFYIIIMCSDLHVVLPVVQFKFKVPSQSKHFPKSAVFRTKMWDQIFMRIVHQMAPLQLNPLPLHTFKSICKYM